MLQGKIKKFKVPLDNSVDNFLKDIKIKKNEYVCACEAEDLDNISLNCESIIKLFNFINESYSNVLLLLTQEGFDNLLNYIRICDNFDDFEQEKIFGCLIILAEKSVDIYKNYFKCLEKCNKKNEWNNGVQILNMIINENNNIVNMVIECLDQNYKEYYATDKKNKFTFFDLNEILISYFNALTFIYINIFNSYYNSKFLKQQNTEIVINVQRGRKKIKKDNEEEKNIAIKNLNSLLNNIVLLLSVIDFNLLYDQVNISVVDIYVQFFLNIYIINQENNNNSNSSNNIINITAYHDSISMIVSKLLKLYIKEENTNFANKDEEKNEIIENSKRDDNVKNDDDHEKDGNLGNSTANNGPKNDQIVKENAYGVNFHSYSFTYIFLNVCKKCTNVNVCDSLLIAKNTAIPRIIIKEFVDYIKDNSLLYLNLNLQSHSQNEIINILNILEYLSKNLSLHLLDFLKDFIDMLGIDIYYIRKYIFDIFKNFIILAKSWEEIREARDVQDTSIKGDKNEMINRKGNRRSKIYGIDSDDEDEFFKRKKGGGNNGNDESDEDNSSCFFSSNDEKDEDYSEDSDGKRKSKKTKQKKGDKKNRNSNKRNNSGENGTDKKQDNQNARKKKTTNFLNNISSNINDSNINTTYKDIINKIILEDSEFLQLCFKECLKNRSFIMNVLISRQYDAKLHVRCHLLKILQELIENNFIPLNYYNNICLICSERINDKSPLVRQRAFSLLSCIASDVVNNKYVIPLDTNKIKRELISLNKSKDMMIEQENKEKGICESGSIGMDKKGKMNENVSNKDKNKKKHINLSDSDSDDANSEDGTCKEKANNPEKDDDIDSVESFLSDDNNKRRNSNANNSKYDLLIKMYNEVLSISMIVDNCVDICFKLLYSIVDADQKSSIKFLILAHMCGNKKAGEHMNNVWSLIFSNNNSIIEIIINEFINVNICYEDYRISAFRLINIIINSKLKDIASIEKIMECLLMNEKSNLSISKLLDELFNIIFVDTFSENKNMIIKEGALLLMKILCHSIHTVNTKKGKKEQYFYFTNKRKHLIILFINQYKDNMHFINLLILILKYNNTNKIIQSLLIILFNLVFDHAIDDKKDSTLYNSVFDSTDSPQYKNKISRIKTINDLNDGSNGIANGTINPKIKSNEYVEHFYLNDDLNMWIKCSQSIVESMYEHFDDFIVIFTVKIKNMLNGLFGISNGDNTSKNMDYKGSKLKKKIENGNNLNNIPCSTLTKFIFVLGHLGLYTYIYAEKVQNKLKKLSLKNENNYGMCTKEEKDREYFDYIVEHMIVCNNLLGKKLVPLLFLIINNPAKFFNECLIVEENNTCDDMAKKQNKDYIHFNNCQKMEEKIYMYYDMYALIFVCLLTLCKFSIISQSFCQKITSGYSKVSIIQLIVSIIIEEENQIFGQTAKLLSLNRDNNIGSDTQQNWDDDNIDDKEYNGDNIDYLSIEDKRGENHKKINQGNDFEYIQNTILYKTISNIRKMLLISYADLLYRHPNILEPYNKYIFKVLNDKDINMRRTAVSVFTHLFMTDTVKAKNTLLVHMMYLTNDADDKISSGSKSFFYELNRKSSITLVNNICDMVSVLANNERKLTYTMNKEILEFLLSFIKKSKYNETLVEKIFKKMKETNINKSDALHLYMQVLLNIQIDEKVLSRINKCFPLIRYIVRENQHVHDSLVLICKKATEKKRGRPADEAQQQQQQQQKNQANENENEKGKEEKNENDKSENKMRELAEEILGKIESTISKAKNLVKAVKIKNENEGVKNEEDAVGNDDEVYSNEE
ncbi:condensin complex subunit 1, putative [Plasmodium chabaudi chabaudi]|uniref:Condensin complex subunit 1, putative n=1 Tax=Plasmodium chabaudi chabaudi TaxID=31271 RepID=A0A4V0K1M6_PLACU|nr:condensin complex subunit 1, putative [Plasmodium chabaudi chabaudi]VTZ66733.1 condensin complex subunit 1, putative [Plasmodium chabaudi chabaudi]|eukprot:XP_742389.2 conserved Plasmodium protein, unknown function [Plasmodium chabaudi chabaudi]